MKCDNFVNEWKDNINHAKSKIIAFRLSPSVLEYIFDSELPEGFQPSSEISSDTVHMVSRNEALDHFINGFSYFFDRPDLISKEFMILKLRELILLLTDFDQNSEIHAIFSNPTPLKINNLKSLTVK